MQKPTWRDPENGIKGCYGAVISVTFTFYADALAFCLPVESKRWHDTQVVNPVDTYLSIDTRCHGEGVRPRLADVQLEATNQTSETLVDGCSVLILHSEDRGWNS